MKLLIIVVGHEFVEQNIPSINSLNKYIINKKPCLFTKIDIALICSNQEQLNIFDNHLDNIKYKICNPKKQLSKMCDFISELKEVYDWYIKTRPDIELLDEINFNKLENNKINARCRRYTGNKVIPYGSSLNNAWLKHHYSDIIYNNNELHIILDDQFYIFDNNIVKIAFQIIPNLEIQNEWTHTSCWSQRNVKLNPFGINLVWHSIKSHVGNIYSNHINT